MEMITQVFIKVYFEKILQYLEKNVTISTMYEYLPLWNAEKLVLIF